MRKEWMLLVLAVVLLSGCFPATPQPVVEPVASPEAAAATTVATAALTPDLPGEPAKSGELTSVTLAMGYIPSVQFAPFYVAQENGYFAANGLDVTFRYGMETDLLKLVATGELQFLIGSGEQVILARSQGLPVRYVMRYHRRFPVVLFAKASSGITSPADLVGKRIGIPGLFGATYVGWEAIRYATGLDASKVNLQSIGFTQATAVSQGQVDAAMDYVVNGPVQLRLAGEQVVVLPVSDYVDLPSNGIITSDRAVQDDPQLVQAMVNAVMHGLVDTLKDPDAAFAASLRAVPEAGGQQTDVNRAIFDESLALWQAEPDQLGLSDPKSWEQAAEFMLKMGLIQQAVVSADLFNNEFVAAWE